MSTIHEALKVAHNYNVFVVIKSKAKTLDGINKAIERTFGDRDSCYETIEDLEKSEREGFISFHSDGFILWIDDGVGYDPKKKRR